MMGVVKLKVEELSKKVYDAVGRTLQRGLIMIEANCKQKLAQPGGGIVYQRGSKTHTASAPGQPPAKDTGRLGASITYAVSTGQKSSPGSAAKGGDGIGAPKAPAGEIIGVAGTNVEYAKFLEIGTSKMAARPYLRPAFNEEASNVKALFEKKEFTF